MRCFISVEIPEGVINKIRLIQNRLPEFDGKKTEPQNLHLTLKFLGEIDKNKMGKIKKELQKIKFNSLNVKIDSLGVFSSKIIKIIWLNITDCNSLHREIDNSLRNLFQPEQRFMSHLTIARVKHIKDKAKFIENLNKIKVPEIKFKINEFQLKESYLKTKGSIYKTLKSYKLV